MKIVLPFLYKWRSCLDFIMQICLHKVQMISVIDHLSSALLFAFISAFKQDQFSVRYLFAFISAFNQHQFSIRYFATSHQCMLRSDLLFICLHFCIQPTPVLCSLFICLHFCIQRTPVLDSLFVCLHFCIQQTPVLSSLFVCLHLCIQQTPVLHLLFVCLHFCIQPTPVLCSLFVCLHFCIQPTPVLRSLFCNISLGVAVWTRKCQCISVCFDLIKYMITYENGTIGGTLDNQHGCHHKQYMCMHALTCWIINDPNTIYTIQNIPLLEDEELMWITTCRYINVITNSVTRKTIKAKIISHAMNITLTLNTTSLLGCIRVYEQDVKDNGYNFKDKGQKVKMKLQCTGPISYWQFSYIVVMVCS